MPPGAGASGRTDAAYGMYKPVLLLGRLVDSRLGLEPESVCATPCPKIHAPTTTTKESVAWKKEKRQEVVEKLHAGERQGMTRQQFARYYLMRLGIGSELKRVALNPEFPYKLASVEEVLALHPELQSSG
jgi:hypothetical protein